MAEFLQNQSVIIGLFFYHQQLINICKCPSELLLSGFHKRSEHLKHLRLKTCQTIYKYVYTLYIGIYFLCIWFKVILKCRRMYWWILQHWSFHFSSKVQNASAFPSFNQIRIEWVTRHCFKSLGFNVEPHKDETHKPYIFVWGTRDIKPNILGRLSTIFERETYMETRKGEENMRAICWVWVTGWNQVVSRDLTEEALNKSI